MATKPAPRPPAPGPAGAKPFGQPKGDEVLEFTIPEGTGGIIPDGQYELKLVNVRTDTSEAGNPMYVWDLIINAGQFKGMDFVIFTALTDNAMWKLDETVKAFGVNPEPGVQMRISKKELIGSLVIGNISVETYKKRTRSVVNSVEAHPQGAGYKPKGSTGNPFLDVVAAEQAEEVEASQVQPGEEVGQDIGSGAYADEESGVIYDEAGNWWDEEDGLWRDNEGSPIDGGVAPDVDALRAAAPEPEPEPVPAKKAPPARAAAPTPAPARKTPAVPVRPTRR